MCNEQHLTICVDLNMIVVVGFMFFFGGGWGFFFFGKSLGQSHAFFIKMGVCGYPSGFPLCFVFFFLPNMDLGSKTTSVEMNDSVCVTFSDNFR